VKSTIRLFVILIIVGAFVLMRCVRVVPAGHVGVVDVFGKVRSEALPSGLHVINPFATLHRMTVQTQEVKETLDTPSSEGLTVLVREGINENLLKWKGIEATKELALSNNSKVVIIGSGREGLPVILGGDTAESVPRQPPPRQ
jgi:regulator of protease activity HflC (stomatin/prohibitin superfamily)